MHLMYTLDESGNRIYTLNVSTFAIIEQLLSDSLFQKATDTGRITKSAHPGSSPLMPFFLAQECALIGILIIFYVYTARFSPDDKFSRHRVTLKKRYGVLLTQLPSKPM